MLIACWSEGGAGKPMPLAKECKVVGSGENVLVSCCIIATMHFIDLTERIE
jgi:hypothetical protein